MSGKTTGDNIGESSNSASVEIPHLSPRKRTSGHASANSPSKDSKERDSVSESKIRKISRATGAPCLPTTSANTTSSTSASTSSSGRELRFLTDFYPDQTAIEGGPLTRSKTRNVESSSKRTGSSSSSARTTSRSTKKASRRNQPAPVIAAPIEFLVEGQARSPTPDPSSSNLTLAGSEVSGFSLASSFGSETIGAELDSAIGLNSANPAVTNFGGLLNTMPTTSRNDGLNSSGNTNQPFLSRSQHVQRASHFLGSLVPRMQHLLGGNVGSSSSTNSASGFAHSPSEYLPHMRVLNLIEELRSDNEIRQSEACGELSDMLLLGNEESLPNFPIRELILCLIALLQKDHNFELMLSASRCITNLQEALPRSHSVLVEAIPILLQKLKRIEYIDVAEQALVILEVISRRNAKNILASSGIQSVISHVDFFSVSTQRLAFQIIANCASYVTNADFHFVQDCLGDLIQRLSMDDKRCAEHISTFFNRLIENMRHYPNRLRQIAGKNHEQLINFQQLLVVQPPTVSSGTFISLIKSLRYMCSCGDLAVALFGMDFSKTLRYLLIGSEKKMDQPSIDATIRPAQQLREIVDLIGELMPKLPQTGVFEVNCYLEQYTNPMSFIQNSRHKTHGSASWFYKSTVDSGDASDSWKPFLASEQLTLERNHSMGVTSMALEIEGQLCEINFSGMTSRIVATGVVLPIDRRSVTSNVDEKDERDLLLEKNFEPFLQFAGAIFPLLVDIGSNSTDSVLRYDCVRVMIRMLCSVKGSSQLLTFIKDVPLAAYLSSTLSNSKNLAMVTLAVQFSNVLLEKLPDLYISLFESEGVFFELKQKSETLPVKKPHAKSSLKSSSSSRLQASSSSTATLDRHKSSSQLEASRSSNSQNSAAETLGRLLQQQMFQSAQTASNAETHSQPVTNSETTSAAAQSALRYAPSAQAFSLDSFNSRGVLPNLFLSAGSLQGPASSLYQTLTNAVNQSYTQAYNLNINSLSNHIDAVASSISGSHSSVLNSSSSFLRNAAAEKLEAFIQNESLNLTKKYGEESANNSSFVSMNNLKGIAESLIDESFDAGLKPLHDLRDVLLTCELSAFQINYSGIISSLIVYLTENNDKLKIPRLERLQRFASVFMLLNDNVRPIGDDTHFPAFSSLINKVILAVERLEQFNVRITNLSGNLASLSSFSSSGGSSSQTLANSTTYLRGAQALRFFQSHQIRCNLRLHPTCTLLRAWRKGRGSIKVDPFTSISAIERYLVDRGIGTSQDESSENEEVSDDDKETSSPVSNFKGRIEILINDSPVPSDISILQAIQQYALSQEDDQETISNSIFVSGHTLYYRGVVNNEDGPSTSGLSSSKGTSSSTGESNTRSVSPMRKSKSSRLKKVKSTDKRSKEDKKEKADDNTKSLGKQRNLDRYLSLSNLTHSIDGDPSENGLVLLRILYGLNRYWWQLYEDEHSLPSTHLPILTQSCFHSAKLNSKVSRQLSDFLTVATQQIPKWTKNLVRSVPFIFPFVTRRNFLYCTAFGRDRALMHLVNETNPDDHDNESNSRLVPRLERRKITVNRANLLKDGQQAMANLGSSRPLLEVSFDGEVGTGFGPTMEFYSRTSRELQKHAHRLWQGDFVSHTEDGETVDYTHGENGLYPIISRQSSASRSLDSRSKRFEFLGRLMAQALLDSRILDIPFAAPAFFRWILGEQENLGLSDFEQLEPTVYNSLRKIGKMDASDFESLVMNFTYPGNELFELVKNGRNKTLTHDNYRQFVDLICQWRLVDGVKSDMQAVQRGFQQVINIEYLAIFDANEMEGLFCGCAESADDSVWSRAILQAAIRPDHGYNSDSIQITWLIDMLLSFTQEERRRFLQFITGSPRLPVGGFKSLHPSLTVVRKIASCAETELPSVATCYNYLKIPNYENYETFVERFRVALGAGLGFHLT